MYLELLLRRLDRFGGVMILLSHVDEEKYENVLFIVQYYNL